MTYQEIIGVTIAILIDFLFLVSYRWEVKDQWKESEKEKSESKGTTIPDQSKRIHMYK